MPQWLLLFPAALIVAVSTCVFRLDSAVAQSPPAIKEPVYDPGKLANRETDTSEAFTSTYQKFDSVPLDETTDPKAGKAFQANIFGVVTDEDDPVENAIVLVRLANYDNDQQPKAVPIVARTRTNERGQYKVQFSHNTLFQQSDFDCIEVLVADRKGRLSMGATKAAERQPADYSARVDIALTSRSTLQSMVQSQDGKPMEGAKVSFQQTFFRYGSSGRDPFGQPRAIDDPFTYKTRVFHFPTPRIRPTVITKSDGKFQIAGPVSAVARVEKESYFQRTPYLYVGNAYDQVRYFRDKLHSPAVIKLEKEFKLTTRVVDEQGDDVREFRTRVGHSFDGQRQEKVSRLVTTKRYLRESANRDGEVRLLITFPEQSGLLSIEKWIDIDELIESPSLDFVAEKGIWLSGQVVKRDTELGVSSALAMWHQNAGSNDHSIYRGATDANGKWKLLAPRKLGYVSIYGKVAGYDLMDYEPRKTPEKLIYKIALVGNEPSLRIPDFKIEPINQRTVVVVDSNGKPVAGASVRTQYHKKYLDKDKRVFRLRDDLASDMQTNADGSCLLTLTRTIWEDGIVSVHNIYVPEGIDTGREKDIDDLLSIGKARIRSGKSPIQPNENGPVKVVLFDLVNVRGRVLVDGKPHPKILVGLATRTKKNGPFDSVYTGFHSTDEGRFEIATPRGREYSVVLMLPRTESSSAKRHIHQTPIEISKGLSWNAGTISVDQSQF